MQSALVQPLACYDSTEKWNKALAKCRKLPVDASKRTVGGGSTLVGRTVAIDLPALETCRAKATEDFGKCLVKDLDSNEYGDVESAITNIHDW
jgi:hypothetical protein